MASRNLANLDLKAKIKAATEKARQGFEATGKGAATAAGHAMKTASETMATAGGTVGGAVTSAGKGAATAAGHAMKTAGGAVAAASGAIAASGAWATVGGAIAASLSKFNDLALDPHLVTRITSAHHHHGVAVADLINKLPGELERYGADAVNNFLNKGHGDASGKHWSHIQSQKHHPELADRASNAIWEDGSTNMSRGAQDMTWQERAHASFDNHVDGLFAAAQTPEFWQRTLGNALEASVYAAAISAVDQLLIHRDELVNGSHEQRKATLLSIVKTSGLSAAGALPVSIFMAIALMLIPSLTVVMGPLGMIGAAGLGIRLITSVVNNPTQQEKNAIRQLQGWLEPVPVFGPSLS